MSNPQQVGWEKEKIEVIFRIEGMDCANCALTLERGVSQLAGVDHVQVNFTTASLEAQGTFDPQKVVARVEALGYRASEGTEDREVDEF